MSSDFAHIHVHTDFSILDGVGKVSEYCEKAKNNNIEYVSITDHGMGAAYPQLIEECNKYNLKPIFGCEIYTNDYNHLIKDFKNQDDNMKKNIRSNNHLLLIAKNNIGYKNLIKLISDGWTDGFYYKPRVSWQQVKERSEGLICCSACLASKLSQLLLNGKDAEAVRWAKEFKEVFKDDYYIELMMIKMKDQDFVNKKLILIANKLNIPLVLTNDVHYCEEKDSYNQDVQLMIAQKKTINSVDKWSLDTKELWYKTTDELDELWENNYKNIIPQDEYNIAKKNTIEICKKCNVEIDTSPKFPQLPDASKILIEECVKSLKLMGLYNSIKYRKRLLKELELISEKKYESYFLIVKDIVSWVKERPPWSVGSGRGCFLPGSFIIIKNGKIEIERIKNGDFVYSHDNKLHEVECIFEYECNENIIEIIIEDGKKIKCTQDHEIRIIRNKKEEWVQAKNLKIGDDILNVGPNEDR